MSIIANTPEAVEAFNLLSLKGALKLEVKGMKASRGFSAFKTVKARFGLTGNKAQVLVKFENLLREKGILS